MKGFTIIALLTLPFSLLAQKGPFTIQGQLGNANTSGTVYLVKAEDKELLDSTFVKNGAFHFTGRIETTTPAYLFLNRDNSGFKQSKETVFFYLEAGKIAVRNMDGQLRKATVDGTPNNAANVTYNRIDDLIESLTSQIEKKRSTATPEQRQSVTFKKEIEQLEKARLEKGKNAYAEFARSHPNAVISLMALTELVYVEDQNKVISIFEALTPGLKNSAQGKKLATQLTTLQNVSIGSMAPLFTMADTSGKAVSLFSLRGKYVLLDMWASWCAPCRQENPNLVKAYQTYRDKNFTILSISLDAASARSKWLAAIQKDNLTWTQVSDLKGWDNEAAKLYGVRGIPQNFLIDPSGKIIAKNLHGNELIEQLSKLVQ